MNDLKGALRTLSQRGAELGSAKLRERVAFELAAGGRQRLARESKRRLPGPVIAAAAAALMLMLFGTLALVISNSNESPVVEEPQVTVPATTIPPAEAATTIPAPIVPVLPPSLTEDEVDELPALGALEAGLSCDELASSGLNLAAVVAYWMFHDTPTGLDPDGNGIPCEADYPGSEVAAVFGDPEGWSIRMVSNLTQLFPGEFVATGPAVDAGVVCPTGIVDVQNNRPPPRWGGLERWFNFTYICDDGTGTFIVGADVFIEADPKAYGVWDLFHGTGSYQSLRGGGGVVTDGNQVAWSDIFTGRATAGTDTNP